MPDARERPVVIFDLGGVLIDWNPRYLYRQLFEDEARMEWFLAEVCNDGWNLEQDAGRPFGVAIEEASRAFPDLRPLIEAYFERWPEMLAGAFEDAVGLLGELKERRVELHALSNWSGETFPVARARYPFLGWFESIFVSGEEGVVKPDLRVFYRFCRRIGHRPERCLLIDDSRPNVVAAEKAGFDVIHHTDAPSLRAALVARGLLAG